MKAFDVCFVQAPACLRIVAKALFLACLVPIASYATDPFWINSGFINTPPQIDAVNFVNSGQISIFTTLPFQTSNTRNFTNSGTMRGEVGWELDNGPAFNGVRRLADNFVNLNTGVIEGIDGGGIIIIGPGGGGGQSLFPSYLWISATNIVNKGTLSVGGNGWMKLLGTNVNLARSAIEVTGINPHGSFNGSPTITNFIPDVAITDVYWGQTNDLAFISSNIWNGSIASAPTHLVSSGPGAPLATPVRFSIAPSVTDSYTAITAGVGLTLTNADGSTTNVVVPTNMVKQAVFIALADPSMSAAVTYFPSTIFGNPYQTICVQMSVPVPDVINGGSTLTTLYFYDTLASQTNRGTYVNATSTALPPFTFERPANYVLSRLDDGRFAAGRPGTGAPEPTFFYDPAITTSLVVTSEYSGYSAFVDNLVTEPPPVAAGTATNFPGRIQLFAENLDLSRTRVRGEGEVTVKATHLLSSAGAAVDCQNLSYILGSTNGNLSVTNLAQLSVTRLKGDIFAWSGVWTNSESLILTNNFVVTNTVDTNGVVTGTNAIPAPLTNTVIVNTHALILDGSSLVIHLPVITWDLVAHSTNIVVADNLAVVQTLLLDGQSFTLTGGLTLSNTTIQSTIGQTFNFALNNWIYTNAPDLLYLTNRGSLVVPSEAHFGDDRPVPYSDFVNAGTLQGGSVSIDSSYIQNSGVLSASIGPLDFEGGMGLFQNGQTTSRGDADFTFSGLKFDNHQLSALGTLNFTVTDGFSDGGAASGNLFHMQNGFNLFVKPAHGDLLGTTFQDGPPRFIEVDHLWAAEDRGATASGYSDNMAVGKLILVTQSSSPDSSPLFFFSGTGGQNALYVDLLDLTSLGSNYQAMIDIDPSLTIYYAAATLGFTPPPSAAGVPQEPEEFLDGQFGGHLRWVSGFAGPNSSVDVVINGVTVSVNKALRFSRIIDSNGNGIPNFFDPFPFSSNPLVLSASLGQANQPPSGAVAVSWKAEAQKSYQVEYTTDMQHPNWQPLTKYSNTASSSSTVTIWDTNAPAGAHRFYRVKTSP